MRWSCLVIIVSNILAGLAIVIYGTVECSPELHPNTAPFLLGCIVAVDNTTMARASISLATDVAVFILPIPVIVNLNMAFRRKIGLGLAFATGLL